ncbi:MAG: hypothetical protein A2Y15_06280 [Clostridiales bacterium GWF2_36_10]|nr:MAG: hypothetical protein A2Y15_06280 [Clostridiales bacterium GWF2_36_10]HAN21876.1 hypothetical protein [Clostridiales bacterium]
MKKDDYLNALNNITLSDDQKKMIKVKIANRGQLGFRKQGKPFKAAITAVLVLIMLAGMIFIPLAMLKINPQDISQDLASSTNEGNNNSQDKSTELFNRNVPEWYEPGELIVNTIKKNPSSAVKYSRLPKTIRLKI